MVHVAFLYKTYQQKIRDTQINKMCNTAVPMTWHKLVFITGYIWENTFLCQEIVKWWQNLVTFYQVSTRPMTHSALLIALMMTTASA